MASIKIDYQDDWTARLRSRLFTQFADAVSWEAFVAFLGPMAQDLEDAFQSLNTLWDIDNSEGAQLDLIGRLIGQPRGGGADDDITYRTFLKARIQANRSTGGGEDIYNVFRALYGETIGLVLSTSPIKTISLRVKGQITAAQGSYGMDFLRDSKEVGVRAILLFQEDTDNAMFTFGTGTTSTAATIVGANTIDVIDTSILDEGESIIVGPQTQGSNGEIFAPGEWFIVSATQISIPPTLGENHSAGTAITMDTLPGLGFDDGTNTYGGKLAVALEA